MNETTGEQDPVVKLIDFAQAENFTSKTQWPDDDKASEGMNQQQQLIRGMLNKSNLLSMLQAMYAESTQGVSARTMHDVKGKEYKSVCTSAGSHLHKRCINQND